MTGRERLLHALQQLPQERPPADFWAEDTAVERLFRYLGHRDLHQFLDKMRVDVREAVVPEPPELCLDDGVRQNYWGERYRVQQTEYGPMRSDLPGALSQANSFAEIQAFPWPDNDAFDYSSLENQCREIRSRGCAVRYGFADVWQRPLLVRGLENALLDLYENPEWIQWLSRRFTDFYLEDYRRAWEASGGRIDLFLIISDLGSQRGPLISTRMFDEFVFPYIKEMVDLVHSFSAFALFHSCGDISSFIPGLIRAGVDFLNPLQPVGSEMRPEALARYRGQICFHGGMDVQGLLPFASEEDVKREARRYFSLLGPGYVLAPTHLFQPDIPPENLIAVYQAFS